MADGRWSHEFTTTIPAARDRVFAALTEPDLLRGWFAEHARVGREVGDPWQFWGRLTPGAAAAPWPEDRLLEHTPMEWIRFAWRFEGCPSEVTLTLQDERDGANAATRLAVRHELAQPLPHPRPVELVDDFWRLSVGNLAVFLGGGPGLVRPDFGATDPEVRLSIEIAAAPGQVWEALMDPEALRQWVGATTPVVERRVGGAYRYGWTYPIEGREVQGGPMTILEMVPHRLLVTDWPDWRGDPSMPIQRVEWHLEATAAGTRVTLVHRGFTRAADISDYPFGWGWFAGELKRVVEQGQG